MRFERWALAATLLVYVGLHAPRLDAPALGRDSWREADGLMVAQNYCREGAPFLSPRVSQRGDTDGATGMELPLLNRWVALVACALRDAEDLAAFELVGRLTVLAFAVLGIVALWALCCRVLSARHAAVATPLYAFSPLVFHYGRSFQPDVPALSLALLGLWLVARSWLPAAAAAFALALLVKLPAAVFLLPAAVLLWGERRRVAPWVSLVAAVAPAALWYHHARQLQASSGLTVFTLSRSPGQLLDELTQPFFWKSIFVQQLFDVYLAPLAAVAAVLALVLLRRNLSALALSMAAATLAFFLIGGHPAAHHLYYGVLAAPALAILAAEGVEATGKRAPWVAAVLVATSLAWTVKRTWHWVAPPSAREPLLAARAEALKLDAAHRPPRAVLFSAVDPTLMCQLGLHGWIAPPDGAAAWFTSQGPRPPLAVVDRWRVNGAEAEAVNAALVAAGYVLAREDDRLALFTRRDPPP